MKTRFKIILGIIVSVEIAVIIFGMYGFFLMRKTRQAQLLAAKVIPINKKFLIFPTDSKLTNFYEFGTDEIDSDTPPWKSEPVTYSINADGLNNAKNYTTQKPEGTYRIMALGDSFTFGLYVNTPDNWPQQLESILNAAPECRHRTFEVLNLGIPGYDMLFAEHRFEVRGLKYKPDTVLWLLNDHNFYSMPQLYKARADEIDRSLSEADKVRAENAGDFAPGWHRAIDEMNQKYNTLKIIEQENASLYTLASTYSGPLVFFTHRVPPTLIALLNIFKNYRNRNTYIDPSSLDIDSLDGGILPDGHPTVTGHRFIAEHIFRYLTANKLIPCGLSK